MHCAHMTELHKLKPSQVFLICDAGGGTVVRNHFLYPYDFPRNLMFVCFQDLAVYKILGQMANLEIVGVCHIWHKGSAKNLTIVCIYF